eukprot:10083726-Heterocapsa_arctica.AAC.1
MTDVMSLSRKPNERINDVLTRCEIVRQQARTEGRFVMSSEGCALQLLRAFGASAQQLMQLIQPFSQMMDAMRRMEHILEYTP